MVLAATISIFLIIYGILTKEYVIAICGAIVGTVFLIIVFKWLPIILILFCSAFYYSFKYIYKTLTKYKKSAISKKFELFYYKLLSGKFSIINTTVSKRYLLLGTDITITVYNSGAVDIHPTMFSINDSEAELLIKMLDMATLLNLATESLHNLENKHV